MTQAQQTEVRKFNKSAAYSMQKRQAEGLKRMKQQWATQAQSPTSGITQQKGYSLVQQVYPREHFYQLSNDAQTALMGFRIEHGLKVLIETYNEQLPEDQEPRLDELIGYVQAWTQRIWSDAPPVLKILHSRHFLSTDENEIEQQAVMVDLELGLKRQGKVTYEIAYHSLLPQVTLSTTGGRKISDNWFETQSIAQTINLMSAKRD